MKDFQGAQQPAIIPSGTVAEFVERGRKFGPWFKSVERNFYSFRLIRDGANRK